MVESHAASFVEWDECSFQELEVLLLEWNGKPVDDRAEDLQELTDTVVPAGLVYVSEEHLGDGLANEAAMGHEFPIHAVEDGLNVVALSAEKSGEDDVR